MIHTEETVQVPVPKRALAIEAFRDALPEEQNAAAEREEPSK